MPGRQNHSYSVFERKLRVRQLKKTIDHIYMESGHSQMECDSAHSAIKSALRDKDIYCPTDIFQNVALARKNNPFKVEYLQTSDIWNYKLLSKEILRNRSWDSNGQKVHWLKIKWMRYEKQCPSVILFKYNYDEDFRKLMVPQTTRGRPSTPQAMRQTLKSLPCLYKEPPAITKSKYDDLQFLCRSNAIPPPYHSFYENLRHDCEKNDRLPEPHIEETEISFEEE